MASKTPTSVKITIAAIAAAAIATAGIGIAITASETPTESQSFNRSCMTQGGTIQSDSSATVATTATLHGDQEFAVDEATLNVRLCVVDGEIVEARIVAANA